MNKCAYRYCFYLAIRYTAEMDLKKYLAQERGRQAALAKAIGAHAPDLSRWADGTRPIPVPFGAPIEKATDGLVTRKEMFPETWRTIWPELLNEPRSGSDRRKPVTT